jgi:hypothetical protein
MKQILHILKQKEVPMDVIAHQAAAHHVNIILMQEAVDANLPNNLPDISVFVLSEGVQETPKGARIGYEEMLSLIFSADTIAVW